MNASVCCRILPLLLFAACATLNEGDVDDPLANEPGQALTSTNSTLRVEGDQIVDATGKTLQLHGFNWFGFNNQSTMVDGLWGGPALALDFATVVHRQKLLGFNAVRLPFSFKDLNGLPPRNYAQSCTLPSPEELARSVTPPGAAAAKSIPPLPAPPSRQNGKCNDYLPNDSTFNRYVWVANFYARNGFYVLVDNHLREDQSALENVQAWAQNWAKLVKVLAADATTKRHLFVDLLNEPDNFGLTWGGGNGKPALKDLYLAAMDAIYAVAPDTLFFVEGTGQSGLQANWGDGFCTDANKIARLGLSDPRPFFNALATKPYGRQVVLSPHIYGPGVTFNPKGSHGADLFDRLSSSFGTLTKQGYGGQKFPIAVGEFGSKFTEEADSQTMYDLVRYLNGTGDAADGRHNAIASWFYWSWNANSGDTGGLVTDNWTDIQWQKIKYLNTLGLRAAGPTPVPPTPVPPTPVPPTPVPPTPVPPTPVPPTPVPPTSGCVVTADVSPPWKDGDTLYATVINLDVANYGSAEILVPWTLTLTGPTYAHVRQSWNWDAKVNDGAVAGQATQSWEVLRGKAANSVNVGLLVDAPQVSLVPTRATLNGQVCTLKLK